jgi:hypothetical protein
MWFRNWRDVGWLGEGTASQRRAFTALSDTGVMQVLAPFDPVLAGTVPLDVDIEDSDLDIICHVPDALTFATTVSDAFSHLDGFVLRRGVVHGDYTTLARFTASTCAFEIFGQDVPVNHQPAVVHLDLEARLLAIGGADARQVIRTLKRTGRKTEPAFAEWLGLDGDPWNALYALASARDVELEALVRKAVSRG